MDKVSDFLTGTREILVQCQSCGLTIVQAEYVLPNGWLEASDGRWYCDDCMDRVNRRLQ